MYKKTGNMFSDNCDNNLLCFTVVVGQSSLVALRALSCLKILAFLCNSIINHDTTFQSIHAGLRLWIDGFARCTCTGTCHWRPVIAKSRRKRCPRRFQPRARFLPTILSCPNECACGVSLLLSECRCGSWIPPHRKSCPSNLWPRLDRDSGRPISRLKARVLWVVLGLFWVAPVVWRFAKVHECWKRVSLPCRHEGRRLTWGMFPIRRDQRGNLYGLSWAITYGYW